MNGPEHFAPVVYRHFVRLKEMTMKADPVPGRQPYVAPPPMSAAQHYQRGEKLLLIAEHEEYNHATCHRYATLAHVHFAAAQAAATMWPAPAEAERAL